MKPTDEQINSIQFDPADPERSFRQLQDLMTRNAETPTAPATPALSQIREEIERLDKAATPGPWKKISYGCDAVIVHQQDEWLTPSLGNCPAAHHDAELVVYLRNNIASLLSIADMLERTCKEMGKDVHGWSKGVEKLAERMSYNDPPNVRHALDVLALQLGDIADELNNPGTTKLSALRSIAQMEEGKTETPA